LEIKDFVSGSLRPLSSDVALLRRLESVVLAVHVASLGNNRSRGSGFGNQIELLTTVFRNGYPQRVSLDVIIHLQDIEGLPIIDL